MALSAEDGPAGRAAPPPPPPAAAYPEAPRDPPPPPGTEGADGRSGADAEEAGHPAQGFAFHLDPGGGLLVQRPAWRRPSRILLAGVLVAVFLVPLMVDGLWWLTLVVSEVVVGLAVILASTAHRKVASAVVGGLALLGLVGLEAYNDVAFGTLSLRGAPPLVFACGTEYTRTTTTPVSVDSGALLRRVGTTPSGLALLVDRRCAGAASVWAFVSTGPHTVLPYLADHYTGPPVPYWG